MYINKTNQQTFGISCNEAFLRALKNAKKGKKDLKSTKPSLLAQLLMKDPFFLSKEVSDMIKANYFAFLNKVK